LETTKNNKSSIFLFLLTAAAGILIFVSDWNSFLQGKEKIYISFIFLVLFIFSLSALYFRFNRQTTSFNKDNSINDLVPGEKSEEEHITDDNNVSREGTFILLKGVFSKPDVKGIGEGLLKNLASEFEIVQGIFFTLNPESSRFTLASAYAMSFDSLPPDFAPGEGLTGEAVTEGKILMIPNLPESFTPVISGLGKAKAKYLYIIPLIHEKKSYGVLEISCFREIEENRMPLLNQLMGEGGLKLSAVLFPIIQ
jgi:hypothetical protein